MTRLPLYLAITVWTGAVVTTAGLGYYQATAAVLLLGAAGLLIAVIGRPPTEPDGLEYEGATPEWADQIAEIGADIRSVLAREDSARRQLDYLRRRDELDLLAEVRYERYVDATGGA